MAQLDAAHHRRRGHGRRVHPGGGADTDDRCACRGQADDRAGAQRGCAVRVARGITGRGQAGCFAYSGGGGGGGCTVAERCRRPGPGRGYLVEGRMPGHHRLTDQLVAGA